jgi:hypothetical protein
VVVLSHPKFVSGFERSSTAPANYGSAISAGQRISNLGSALGTIELAFGTLFNILRLIHSGEM